MFTVEQEPKRRRFRQRDKRGTLKMQRQTTDSRRNGYGDWTWREDRIMRNAPHIEEWDDIYMWDGHRPVDWEDEDDSVRSYYNNLEAMWDLADAVEYGYVGERTKFGIFGSINSPAPVYAGHYDRPEGCSYGGICVKCGYKHYRDIDEPLDEYPVEDHDLDYGDYYEPYDYRADYYDHFYDDMEADERHWQIEDMWNERHTPYWIKDDQVDIAFEEHMPLTESELAEQEARFDIAMYLEYGERGLEQLPDEVIDANFRRFMQSNEAWNRDSPFYGLHPVRNN